MWLPSGSLACDTCPEVYPGRGARGSTAMAARAKGWHIYEGAAADGETELIKHLCPPCVGTPRSPLRKPPPALPGDDLLPLFSEAA